jgi:hypothetical protein
MAKTSMRAKHSDHAAVWVLDEEFRHERGVGVMIGRQTRQLHEEPTPLGRE